MPTNLQAALKKDFAEFKKQLAALEKQKAAIDKKTEGLEKKFETVLDLINYKPKAKSKTRKAGKPRGSNRAPRGESQNIILGLMKKARKSLKAIELINLVKNSSVVLSTPSIRQQLPKMVKEGKLKKNKDKTYSVA